MNEQPTWQFAPRGIGVEVIQDSASAHFRDDPIRKLVREALQNSLDAKEDGLDAPVEVNSPRFILTPATSAARNSKGI